MLAVVALGSNLGDRRGHLEWAAQQLTAVLADLRISSVVETDAVGVPDIQPPYLNAVVVGQPIIPARELVPALLALEARRGRTRTSYRGARTLDLDLILYGDEVIEEAGISVPHPRFRERLFVLEPLATLAPEMRDPMTGQSIAGLLEVARAAMRQASQ